MFICTESGELHAKMKRKRLLKRHSLAPIKRLMTGNRCMFQAATGGIKKKKKGFAVKRIRWRWHKNGILSRVSSGSAAIVTTTKKTRDTYLTPAQVLRLTSELAWPSTWPW